MHAYGKNLIAAILKKTPIKLKFENPKKTIKPKYKLEEAPIALSLGTQRKLNLQNFKQPTLTLLEINTPNQTLSSKQIAYTTYQLARLGLSKNDALDTKEFLIKAIPNYLKLYTLREIILILYSMAKLQILNYELLKQSCLYFRAELDELNSNDCLQLYTAFTYYCLNNRLKWQQLNSNLPPNYLPTLAAKTEQILSKGVTVSKFHQEVLTILSSIPLSLKFSAEKVIYCMIVDIYLERQSTIIEVNGPYHFTKDQQFNVSTLQKQDLLRSLGYRVVNINYQDWDILATNQSKKDFLMRALNAQLGLTPKNSWLPRYTHMQKKLEVMTQELKTKQPKAKIS